MENTIADIALEAARRALTHFVVQKAGRVGHLHGFSYEEVAEGHPRDYEEVRIEWAYCLQTKRPFRVWSGGSDNTIYTTREGNWAFRFWHDSLHALYSLGMSSSDEYRVGCIHAEAVAQHFGRHSLEHQLMLADTVAQTLLHDATGTFAGNQLEYVKALVHAWNRASVPAAPITE